MNTEQLRAQLAALRAAAIGGAAAAPAPARPMLEAAIDTLHQVAAAIVDSQGELERRIGELEQKLRQ